ncbi:MAG: hypothetical protein NZ955_03600 [Candidatus Bathyarchaeota archaeon]|nr:hypothetical protein [Candidatus Bathyarchaeota archaeon]
MMMPFLAYAMSILILTSIISYLAGRVLKNRTGFLTASGLALATLFLITIIPEVSRGEVYEEYMWTHILPSKFGLRADGLSLTLAIMVGLLSVFASIYSVEYMRNRDEHGLFFGLLSLMAFTMTGAVLAVDLAILFFFWEFTVVIPVFIIAKWGYGARWSTAIRFFLFSRLGGGLLLAGLILIYVSFGSLDMRILPYLIREYHLKPEILTLIAALMILGFSVKMAIWPFHGWIPSAYVNAPIPVAMILSSVMSKLGVYGIVRVIQIFHEAVGWDLQNIVAVLALLTALYGGAMASIRDDLREILAYSSMSHMGYILLGFSILAIHGHGFTGALLHMLNHALSKGILFLCVGLMLRLFGTVDIRKLRGCCKRSPLLFALAVIGALGLIGLPPTLGFWSKDMLLGFSLKLGYPIASLMIVAAFLSIVYNFRWILYVSTGIQSGGSTKLPYTMATPVILLAALTLTSLTYVDYLTYLMNLEHIVVEPIPLLITVISLAIGFSTVYVTISRGWIIPNSILGIQITLLKIASLEWLYTEVFTKGILNLAYYAYRWIEGAIDRSNYIVAGCVSQLSRLTRKLQTGVLSYNMLTVTLTLLALLLVIIILQLGAL